MRNKLVDYQAYLSSARWKNTRVDLMKMRGKCCEECGERSFTLEVHHLNYDRLGSELPGDLKILCRNCHKVADAKRRMDLQKEFEKRKESAWEAGFNTWCERVHGHSSGCATIADEEDFNNWLEEKAYYS